jgi:hypothetical protein
MLNFAATPRDHLIVRLNAMLLPHRMAPAVIARQIGDWLDQPVPPDPAGRLMLVTQYEPHHCWPLLRGQYRDGQERDFVMLEAGTRLDAEYGLARRLCSMFTLPALPLISPEERYHAMQGLKAALYRLERHSWGEHPEGFRMSIPVLTPHREEALPANPAYLHAAMADHTGLPN